MTTRGKSKKEKKINNKKGEDEENRNKTFQDYKLFRTDGGNLEYLDYVTAF